MGDILDRTLIYRTHITTVQAMAAARNNIMCERSAHAHHVNPVLNDACRSITGCLQPSNIDTLYLLSGIAPPAIWRSVAAQREREANERYLISITWPHSPNKRLKSRSSFIHDTDKLMESSSTRAVVQPLTVSSTQANANS